MAITKQLHGIAKTLFSETKNSLSFFSNDEHVVDNFVQKSYSQGVLSYLDISLAQLLADYLDVSLQSDEFLSLCFLSRFSKEGHLCVVVEDNHLSPNPLDIYPKEFFEEEKVSQKEIVSSIHKGFLSLKKLVAEFSFQEGEYPQDPLGSDGKAIYLQKWWLFETLCSYHLQRLTSYSSFDKPISSEKLNNFLTENNSLLELQKKAVIASLNFPVTIICGGPGTGKTYTASSVLHALQECVVKKDEKELRIVLTAPTGKAAANLQASLSHSLSEETELLQVSTLHSLLELRKCPEFEKNPVALQVDLIMVDEASMVDIKMMALLLSSLKVGGRLVLIGDSNQLPPVEAGTPFRDFLKSNQSGIEITVLEANQRLESNQLLLLASLVKDGKTGSVVELLKEQSDSLSWKELKFEELSKKQRMLLLDELALPFIQMALVSKKPLEVSKEFLSHRILTPQKKGVLGVEQINEQLLKRVLQKHRNFKGKLSLPVIQVKNDYTLDIMNGEVGVLQLDWYPQRKLDFSLLTDQDVVYFSLHHSGQPFANVDQEIRKIPALFLNNWEFAFCLSVHKSQGSEFQHAVLLLSPGSELFGREVFYTGITRAKSSLEMWSDTKTIEATLEKKNVKVSQLTQKLSN
jgi:exodeoxyribonuclease V alpha subunit